MLALPLSVNALEVHSSNALPENCRHIAEIKVGDIAAFGKRSAAEVRGELVKEANDLGGNYLLIDIKRVNHPKSGVYYWGWGTVGQCNK